MQQIFLLGAIRPLPYFFSVTATLGILFSFIAPDSDRPVAGELTLWLAQTLVPLCSILAMHFLLSRQPWFNRIGNLLKLVVSGLAGILAYLPLAIWIDALFDGQPVPSQKSHIPWALFDELGAIAPPILIGWLAMNAPWLLGYQFERANNPDAVPVSNPDKGLNNSNAPLPIQKKAVLPFLPPRLNDLVLLKAELHYLLVVTTTHKSLELFNLRDAVNVLGDIEGMTPHRSWWVNRQHIDFFTSDGRQGKLTMKNGEQVPVSRRKLVETRKMLTRWGIKVV